MAIRYRPRRVVDGGSVAAQPRVRRRTPRQGLPVGCLPSEPTRAPVSGGRRPRATPPAAQRGVHDLKERTTLAAPLGHPPTGHDHHGQRWHRHSTAPTGSGAPGATMLGGFENKTAIVTMSEAGGRRRLLVNPAERTTGITRRDCGERREHVTRRLTPFEADRLRTDAERHVLTVSLSHPGLRPNGSTMRPVTRPITSRGRRYAMNLAL